MAAGRLLDELLRRDALQRYQISVFGEEPYGCYNRILLHRLLSGGTLSDILLKPATWYEEHNITFYPVPVTQLNPYQQTITTAAHQVYPFDVAVLATGSVPVIPKLEGLQRSERGGWRGVVTYRTVADCQRIQQWATPGRNAVVLGGGLLGLEAAKTLLDMQMSVTVLHAAEWVMNRQLDEVAGRLLQQSLEQQGLRIRTAIRAIGFKGDVAVQSVQLADGTVLLADLVVLACGVRPRVELAQQAGLPVKHGIIVDDQLRTSHPNIYAVGECAEHRGVVYGIVTPIYEQCRVLAEVLTVAPQARYCGSVCYTRLKVAGVEVVSMGDIQPHNDQDEVVQVFEPHRRTYRKLVIRDERLVGAILLGDTTVAPALMRRLERGDPLPSNRIDLLATPYRRDPTDADGIVCHCHQVRRRQLLQAIKQGCQTLADVANHTGAGTGCGSCRTHLARWLAQQAVGVATVI
jgi:nitrite reductase (NADH) large subunit